MVQDVGIRLGDDHIYLLAAGVAFNVLMCFIPLTLVALYIAGAIVDIDRMIDAVAVNMRTALPPIPATEQLIASVTDEIRSVKALSGTAGLIGSAVLLWTSSALFSSLRTGFNAIFHIPTPKFFLWYKVKDIFFTVITCVLILATVVTTPLISILNAKAAALSPDNYDMVISNSMSLLINSVSAFLLFYVLLRFVPNRPQPFFIVMTATLCGAVLWESARFVFTWYLTHIASFGRFYGTFTVIIVAAVWMYYSVLIVFVSAEIAEYLHERRTQEE